jgi:hypothetical protein
VSFSDSSAVDEAIIQHLRADAELAGLLPDGVFWDVAPPNATAFVVVSLVDAVDGATFDAVAGGADEVLTYDVLAMVSDSSGEAVLRRAAARLREVLQGAVLPIDGFDCLAVLRAGRRRHTVVDPINDVRWLQRGGRYQVTVQPQPTL